MKTALITGITGQDGAYLARLLLNKGYEVHGMKRRSSLINTARIDDIYEDASLKEKKFKLHYGDLTDSLNIVRLISEIRPTEIYNLGAMSHVQVSFEMPEYAANADGVGTLRILEALRILGLNKTVRFYQASTSELYGLVREVPQQEKTQFHPRSPYAVAKLYAYWITVNYREAYGMFACNGILFNHESPLRGETFVTRKITRGVASIAMGNRAPLLLGNLDARRDWGHAEDYVEAMWLMMQHEKPLDLVIATGETTSVRQFLIMAFRELGISIEFEGTGRQEVGVVRESITFDSVVPGQVVVRVDEKYYRPSEVDLLLGDSSRARQELGWTPKRSVENLVREMVTADLKIAKEKVAK